MSDENYQQLAKEWFGRADDDLLFAKAGFKKTGIARDACFLAHQAVEKYLKGYLASCGVDAKRIHILRLLLSDCIEKDEQFLELKDSCEFLDKFYRPARYPGEVELDFSKDEATRALEIAEEVIDFIKKKVLYADV